MGQLTTPNYGWPYPDSSDPTKDGATRMGNLGKAIDTTLKLRINNLMMQAGNSVVTTNAGGAATVTYPTPFAIAPGLSITGATTAQDSIQPVAFLFTSQTTPNYFTCYIKNLIGNGWMTSTTVRIYWVAIGAAP